MKVAFNRTKKQRSVNIRATRETHTEGRLQTRLYEYLIRKKANIAVHMD